MRGHVWSPVVWSSGERLQKNFSAAQWCVLDFDCGEMSLGEAQNTFCDMVHVIGTTKSHRVEKNGRCCDRFRVALRFSEVIRDLRVYRYNMAKMTHNYPCDSSCRDGARYFFPCTQIVSICDDEDAFQVDVIKEVPESFERTPKAKFGEMSKAFVIPRRVIYRLSRECTENRNTFCYGLGADCARVGIPLERVIELIERSQTGIDLSCDDYMQGLINGHKAGLEDMSERKT